MATALQKSGSNRRLGFSVEGKTLQRDGKIVKRSWIKDIAITAEPVNHHTYLDVIKSISAAIEENGYVEDDSPVEEKPALTYWDRMESIISRCLTKIFGHADEQSSPPGEMVKMLEAGHQNPPESGGSALRRESIDKDLVNLDIPQAEGDELTEEAAVELLKRRGYSEEAARRVAGLIYNPNFKVFMADTIN